MQDDLVFIKRRCFRTQHRLPPGGTPPPARRCSNTCLRLYIFISRYFHTVVEDEHPVIEQLRPVRRHAVDHQDALDARPAAGKGVDEAYTFTVVVPNGQGVNPAFYTAPGGGFPGPLGSCVLHI